MFKQRLMTALCLIPLVFILIGYGSFSVFAGAVLALLVWCAVEWLQLVPLHSRLAQAVLLGSIIAGGVCIHWVYTYWFYIGMGVWAGIIVALLTYPATIRWWGSRAIVCLFALTVLPLFAQSLLMVFMHAQGRALLVYLLLLVWAADTGAYIAGKQWGRHTLIPRVSPGKTWEGLLGGLVLSLFVAVLGSLYFRPGSLLIWLGMAALVMLISLAGDLFISMLKRRVQIKDTGNRLPGHGGILDRLDSLIAATPIFYWGIVLLTVDRIP